MKTELEKCLDGEFFNGSDAELAAMTLNAKRLFRELNCTDYGDTQKRKSILRELLGEMGDDVCVDIDFHCEYGKHIRLEIGNDVLIASNVQIYTATHSTRVRERVVDKWEKGREVCKTYALPVKICDGAWIGGGAIILPGVTIGKGCVIGAGSVVTRDVEDNCVAVGNPCRVIRRIDNGD